MNSKNNNRLLRSYPVTHDFLNDPDFAEFLARAEANDPAPDTPTPNDVAAQYIAPAPPSHSEFQESTPEVVAQYIAPAPPSHSEFQESILPQPIQSKWSVALDRPTRIAISPRIKPRPLPPIRGAPRPRKNRPIFQSHIDILIIFIQEGGFPTRSQVEKPP